MPSPHWYKCFQRWSSQKTVTAPSESRTPDLLYLPPGSIEPSLPWLLIISVLHGIVIIVLIVVALINIFLQHYNNKLTTQGQITYTMVTTLIATGVATATESEIRKLWAYVALKQGERSQPGEEDLRPAVIVGLAGPWNTIRKGHITLVFALAGFVTLAIVTGLQPTSMIVSRDTPIYLSRDRNLSGNAGFPLGDECNEPWVRSLAGRLPTKWFAWTQPDGTNLTVRSNINAGQGAHIRCPTYAIRSTIETLDQNISITLPGGVNVNRFAYGVPFDLFKDKLIGIKTQFKDVHADALARWSASSFESASVCVPVIKDKIAMCSRAETFALKSDRVSISHGNCTVSKYIDRTDALAQRRLFVSGACSSDRPVGRSRVLIGATYDYADELCSMTGFPSLDDEDRPVCAVVCDIDIAPSLEFHRLMIRIPQASGQQTRVLEVVGAKTTETGIDATDEWGERCHPTDANGNVIDISAFRTATALAVSAAASWQLLSESDMEDGYLATLLAAGEKMLWHSENWKQKRQTDNGALHSTLEELLTMASRLALGFHYGSYAERKDQLALNLDEYGDLTIEVNGGISAHESVRVGTNSGWAVLFILPSLSIEIVLWTLWRRVKKIRTTVEAGEKSSPVVHGVSRNELVGSRVSE